MGKSVAKQDKSRNQHDTSIMADICARRAGGSAPFPS
jgi:hypothetical protein